MRPSQGRVASSILVSRSNTKDRMKKILKIQKEDYIIMALVVLIVGVLGYIFVVHANFDPYTEARNVVKKVFSGNSGAVVANIPNNEVMNNAIPSNTNQNTHENNTTNTPSNSSSGNNDTPNNTPTIEHVADALSKTSSLTYDAWDWDEGVALQGLLNYSDATGDSQARNIALQKFYTLYSKAPKNESSVLLANQTILGEAALAAYKSTKDTKYLNTAKMLGQALLDWSALAPNGAFLHYYPKYCSSCDNKNYVWSDTLYMTVPFLVRLYEVTGDSQYLQKAASQVVLHAEYLQDANGLIHHASKTDGKTNEFQFWARANGWFAGSAVAVLVDLPKTDPKRSQIENIVKKQMTALRTSQDAGLWHTVISHNETYKESSGSALITYAMLKAVRLGVIDSSFSKTARESVAAIQNQVNSSGVLQNTSAGTSPSSQVAYYQSIAHSAVQLYGQGAYFNMIAEWSLVK